MVLTNSKHVVLLNRKWRRRSIARFVYGVWFVCVPFMTAAYDWSQQHQQLFGSLYSYYTPESIVGLAVQTTSVGGDDDGEREVRLASVRRELGGNATDSATSDEKKSRPFATVDTAPAVTPYAPSSPFVRVEPVTDDESATDDDFSSSSSSSREPRTTRPSPRRSPVTPSGHSRPVVYRYFGRKVRARANPVPFILLGPCADHWKETGKVLARRGYNVMACEEIDNDDDDRDGDDRDGDDGDRRRRRRRRGDQLVRAVLEALCWKRAVLVGCDDDSRSVLEAALELGPERVAGLVLLGNLTEAERLADEVRASCAEYDEKEDDDDEERSIDLFLHEHVECPATVVWNGDVQTLRPKTKSGRRPPLPSFAKDLRTAVVGGGSAPHRRAPEHFAWVLSRFAEERLSDRGDDVDDELSPAPLSAAASNDAAGTALRPFASPGSLVVTGRVVASVILYFCAVSVTVHQYRNLKCSLDDLQGHCRRLGDLRRRGLRGVVELTRKYGVLHVAARRWRARRANVVVGDAIGEKTTEDVVASTETERERDGGNDAADARSEESSSSSLVDPKPTTDENNDDDGDGENKRHRREPFPYTSYSYVMI